jgi:hypothetical protein
MRTYDKLIATIPGRQGAGHLRARLGVTGVGWCNGMRPAVARPKPHRPQDSD